MVKKQLGHQSPLGAFGNLGQSTLTRSAIFLQRRALGSQSLSILNLKAFYPNGFPETPTETEPVESANKKIARTNTTRTETANTKSASTDNVSQTQPITEKSHPLFDQNPAIQAKSTQAQGTQSQVRSTLQEPVSSTPSTVLPNVSVANSSPTSAPLDNATYIARKVAPKEPSANSSTQQNGVSFDNSQHSVADSGQQESTTPIAPPSIQRSTHDALEGTTQHIPLQKTEHLQANTQIKRKQAAQPLAENYATSTSSPQIQRQPKKLSPSDQLGSLQVGSSITNTGENKTRQASNISAEQKTTGRDTTQATKQQVAPLRADIQRYFSPAEHKKSEPTVNTEPLADKNQPLFNQTQAIQAKSDQAKVDHPQVGSTSKNHIDSTSYPVDINGSTIHSASPAATHLDPSTDTIARKVAQKDASAASATVQNSDSLNDSTPLFAGSAQSEITKPLNNNSIQRSTQTSLNSTLPPPSQTTEQIRENTQAKREPLDSPSQSPQTADSRVENSSVDAIDASPATHALQRSSERSQRESASTPEPLDVKANPDQKNSSEAATELTSAVASLDTPNKITSQPSSIQRSGVEPASESVSSTASSPLESADKTPSATAQPAIDSSQNNTASMHQLSHDVANINVAQSLQSLRESLRAPLSQPSQTATSGSQTLQPKLENNSPDNSLSENLTSAENVTPIDNKTLQLKAQNSASTSLTSSTSTSSTDNQIEKTLSSYSTDTTNSIQLKAEAPQTESATANAHSKVTASVPTESITSISIAKNDTSSDSTIQRTPDTDIAQRSADIASHQKISEQPSAPETIQKKSSTPLASVSREVDKAPPTQFSNAVSAKGSSTEGNASTQSISEHHAVQAKGENHSSQSVTPTQQIQRVSSTERSASNTSSPVPDADRSQKTIQSAEQLIPRMSDRSQKSESSTRTTAADIPYSQQAFNDAQPKTSSSVENAETTTPLIQTKPVAHTQQTTDTKAFFSKTFLASEGTALPQNEETIQRAEETAIHRTSLQQQQIRSQPQTTASLNPSNESIQRQSISPEVSPVIDTAAIAQPTSTVRSHSISQPTHTDIQRSTIQPAIETSSIDNLASTQPGLDTMVADSPRQGLTHESSIQREIDSNSNHQIGRMETSHPVDEIAPSSSLSESLKTTNTAIQRSSVSEIPPPLTEELSQQPTNITQATTALTDSVIQTKSSQQQSGESSPQSQSAHANSSEKTANVVTEPITSMPSSEVTNQRKVDIAATETVNVDQPQQAQAVDHGTIQRTPELTETGPLNGSLETSIMAVSKIIQRQTALPSNSDTITVSSKNAPINHVTSQSTNQSTSQVSIESTAADLGSTAQQEVSQQTSSSSASIQRQTDHELGSEKAEAQKSSSERLSNSPSNTVLPDTQAGFTPEILTQSTQAIQRETEHTQATHTNSNVSKSNTSDSNGSKVTNRSDIEHSAVKLSSSDTIQTRSNIVQAKADNRQNKPTTTPNTQPAASHTIQRLAKSSDSLIQPASIPTNPSVSTHHPTDKATDKPLEPSIQRTPDHVLSTNAKGETSLTKQSQQPGAAEQHINESLIQRQLGGSSTLTSELAATSPSVTNPAEQTSFNNEQPHKTPTSNSPDQPQPKLPLQRNPETLNTSIVNLAAIDTSVAQPTLSLENITAQRQIDNSTASESLGHSSATESIQASPSDTNSAQSQSNTQPETLLGQRSSSQPFAEKTTSTETASTETASNTSPSYTAKTLIQRMTVDSQIPVNEVQRSTSTLFSDSSAKKTMVQKEGVADSVLTSHTSQTQSIADLPDKKSQELATSGNIRRVVDKHPAIQRANDTLAEYTKQHTESSNTIQSIQRSGSSTANTEAIAQPTLQTSASITDEHQPSNTFVDTVQRKSEDNSSSQLSQKKSEEQLSAPNTLLSSSELSQPLSIPTPPPSTEQNSAIRRKDGPEIAASLNNLQHTDNPIQRQATTQATKPNQSQPLETTPSQQWSNLEDLVTQLSEDTAAPQQNLQAKHDGQQNEASQNIEDIVQRKPIDERIPSEWSNLEGLVNNLLGEAPSQPSGKTAIQKKKIDQQASQAESFDTSNPAITPRQLSSSASSPSQAQSTLIQASTDDTPAVTIMRSQDNQPPTNSKQYSKYLELLAQEVYGLLRQRLTLEQERRGPKYPR